MNILCPTESTPGFLDQMHPKARALYRWIEAFAKQNKLEPPFPLSICRSFERQKQIQEAWDRGEREGLSVRPADPENSLHVPGPDGLCRAFDLGNNYSWLALVGPAVMKNVPGARWGGLWLPPDYPHFDVETRPYVEIRLV